VAQQAAGAFADPVMRQASDGRRGGHAAARAAAAVPMRHADTWHQPHSLVLCVGITHDSQVNIELVSTCSCDHVGDADGAAGQAAGAFSNPEMRRASGDGAAGALQNARLLPFPRGALSFGAGIGLKLAVTRWANWAADVGLHNAKNGPEEGCAIAPRVGCDCPAWLRVYASNWKPHGRTAGGGMWALRVAKSAPRRDAC